MRILACYEEALKEKEKVFASAASVFDFFKSSSRTHVSPPVQCRWRSVWPAYSSRGSATETYATSLYPRITKQSGPLSRRCYRHLHSRRTSKTIPTNTKTETTTYPYRDFITQFAARTCYARRTAHIYTTVTICLLRNRIPTETRLSLPWFSGMWRHALR